MIIEITEKEKEELLRALKSHRLRLLALISSIRNQKVKEEFNRRKEVANNLISKLEK